jgi:hypothetical protein
MLPEGCTGDVVMSDRGIPASYRTMNGYGSHTYSMINAQNERFWVKFHFKTLQGFKNLTTKRPRPSRQVPREAISATSTVTSKRATSRAGRSASR